MNRKDFQELADVRVAEATALLSLAAPMPDGAYYLGGYAVECALKACIAKLVDRHDFPDKQFVNDSHSHNLESLLKLAGLRPARDADAFANSALAQNWSVVANWNERSRYERRSQIDAQKLLEAITHSTNGVLPWIKVRW